MVKVKIVVGRVSDGMNSDREDPRSLAYKVNQVTTTASEVLRVCSNRAGQNGVATIIYEEAE